MAAKRKKNKAGYYEIRRKVEPYKDRNGNIQNYKKFYGKTIKEAERKYNEYKAGNNKAPAFFDDLINDFIQDTFLPDPALKPRTKELYIKAYRRNLEPQKDFIHLPVDKITYQDIQKAYNAMSCAPATIEACHKLLRHFFRVLLANRIIAFDPLLSVKVPKAAPRSRAGEIVILSDQDLSRIKEYIGRRDLPAFEQKRVDRLRLLILLAINTGMRSSEMLALTYDDLRRNQILVNKQVSQTPKFKDGIPAGYDLIVTDPKTPRAVRSIPIRPELRRAIQDHEKWHRAEMIRNGYRTDFIFTTNTGRLYELASVRHSLNKIHAAAGVPEYGLHAYRRTFASRLAAAGTPIQVLSDLLGHSDISVTAKYYINVSNKEKRKAISKL